ncbi:MAG: TIGR02281 family clan AA aspartic protease [Paracoccaceae bacterium]|nr:TIGR02281 family clan AA aspartic protease [Paracoccaceae bacterium]
MDSQDLPRLAYLVLLGIAVAGWFLAENRQSLGKTARQAAAWLLIFLGVIAAVGLWSDIRDDVAPQQAVFEDGARIEVPRSPDGHYHLTLRLNGTPVDFIVDTGASSVVLSESDARRIGLDPAALRYTGIANTANGTVRTARVVLDEIALGGQSDRNFPVLVNEGESDLSLLGMDYLSRFERIEISGGRLILER